MTYEGMASYWPTQAAREDDPVVAELMNTMPKIVVSTTLESADWHNTTLVGGNVAEELSKLKQQPGKDLAIMGSPNLTVSLIGMGLVDELRVDGEPGGPGRRASRCSGALSTGCGCGCSRPGPSARATCCSRIIRKPSARQQGGGERPAS